MSASQIRPDEQARVLRAGDGLGYFVVAVPAALELEPVHTVPLEKRRAIAGPYTNYPAARNRASQENWRRARP